MRVTRIKKGFCVGAVAGWNAGMATLRNPGGGGKPVIGTEKRIHSCRLTCHKRNGHNDSLKSAPSRGIKGAGRGEFQKGKKSDGWRNVRTLGPCGRWA